MGTSSDRSPLAGPAVLTPDGRTAIGGTTDGAIRLWDLADPRHPASLGPPLAVATEGTTKTIQGIVLTADGRTAAVSSSDSSVHLIDVTDRGHPVVVSSVTVTKGSIAFGVRFSPDGKLLAVAGADAKGYLWDVSDRQHPRLLRTVTGFGSAVFAVAFSADGSLLAFGGADYTVRLVELARRDEPVVLDAPLAGPVGEVYELSFDPTRNVLAVSSLDRSIWLWDLRTPRRPTLLATLTAATGGLFTVGFSPDGRTLAAGGRDIAVRLWNTDPDSVASWICANAGEPITPSEWAQFMPGQSYRPPCR
jgi:WD40 repeat protein